MALINSTAIPSGAGYEIEQSLRFDNSDSPYLSKTPTSAGNRKTWTFSCWTKRGRLGTNYSIFSAKYGVSWHHTDLMFNSDNRLQMQGWADRNPEAMSISSDELFRDTSAWYHIVLNFDCTQPTKENRVKIYVNGSQIAMSNSRMPGGYTWGDSGWPVQNRDDAINSTNLHTVGSTRDDGSYYDGYLAEVNFVDGLVKAPADFGETGDYGEWKPIEYSGSYGTNGFYLPFNTTQGIIAAGGGSVTTVGDYKIHSFTSNGTFTPSSVAAAGGFVQYLVVAGGGAAGRAWNWGGGGGAGGMREGYLEVTAQAYAITVGAGGVKGTNGGNGANSVFSSITSTGGGAGSSGYGGSSPVYQSPTSGGSGGGSISGAGSGIAGQGFAGGNGAGGASPYGGGGGGAGETGSTDAIMDGGDGKPSFITGSSVTYAGGGAGSKEDNTKGTGGAGGGGTNAAGTNGLGGGAGSAASDTNGGSGIVIIKYRFQ